MNKETKAIIFDFDGVIHDTFEFHKNKIKEFAGIEMSDQDFRDIHNGNFFKNAVSVVSGMDWIAYRDYIYPDISVLKIKDEIRATLLALAKDHDLFIVSSGGAKNMSDYLGNNGILDIFKEILGFESHKYKVDKFKFIFEKYGFGVEECLFVTDTLGDILEANEVGLKTVAVDFGFHERALLEQGKPFRIISHFEDLLHDLN